MSNDWKNVLKTQHNELKSIQKMDSINDSRVNSDIEKLLSRPNSSRNVFSAVKAAAAPPPPAPSTPKNEDSYPPAVDYESEEDPHYGDIYGAEVISPSPTKKSSKPLMQNPLAGPSVTGPDPNKAPEAADRFARAKVNMLTKQLEEGLELRRKMEEQNRDLQRQLKTERDENKGLNKRISLLEAELRKNGNNAERRRHSDIGTQGRRGSNLAADGGDGGVDQSVVDNLNDIIADLKKNLETTERLAKQSESSVKTKDSQLRRAAETITRFKTQLQEAQLQLQGGLVGDKARVEALEARVKVLEKQRNELLEAFRKQMKLIDILKRQKVHTEAARLLNFTEEEFMKTLDWKI